MIYHPNPGNHYIGQTKRAIEYLFDQDHWAIPGLDEEGAYVRVDCGFVRVTPALHHQLRSGVHRLGNVGPVLPINVDSLDIIGKEVCFL